MKLFLLVSLLLPISQSMAAAPEACGGPPPLSCTCYCGVKNAKGVIASHNPVSERCSRYDFKVKTNAECVSYNGSLCGTGLGGGELSCVSGIAIADAAAPVVEDKAVPR